ncbi:hypothetical protein LTR53_004488 [Teratosphaeriaceae sp. CCFEE 6253]|nr:hypothetical protein LTR53_004488 [Teratosphaeriaceae sp. CCFEE 6253]
MGASIAQGLKSSDGNGFRQGVMERLQANGTQTEMVGSQSSGEMRNKSDYSGGYDLDANVILLLVGINDCWFIKDDVAGAADPRAEAGVQTAKRFATLLGSIHTHAPDALVLAATLPRNLNDWEDQCIQATNADLNSVIRKSSAQGQQIRMVDMYPVVPTDEIQDDGTHPTDHGYQLMAQQWYDAIDNATKVLCMGQGDDTPESRTGTIIVPESGTATLGTGAGDSLASRVYQHPISTSSSGAVANVVAPLSFHAFWLLLLGLAV